MKYFDSQFIAITIRRLLGLSQPPAVVEPTEYPDNHIIQSAGEEDTSSVAQNPPALKDQEIQQSNVRLVGRLPNRWRLIVTLLLIGLLVWLRPSDPSVLNLAVNVALPITPTAPQRVATATATALPPTKVALLLPTPTPVVPSPTPLQATSGPTDTALLASLLAADVPVIELPLLENLALGEVLPEVAAEGGKPIIIQALAANQSIQERAFTLEQFLEKRPRVLPAIGFVPSAAEAAKLQEAPPTPTPVPIILAPGRQWPRFLPAAPNENDHFWVGRPFAPAISGQVSAPYYQFGSTAGGRYRVHHGVDISNPFGTPVLSAATGEVVHAGMDDPQLLGPYNRFYGNTVVIRLDRQLPVAGGGLDVYLLYGHLSQVSVQVGQRVQPEDVIGLVGMTGIAIGPHLHVEMRVGANTYEQSVNPYLWLQPPAGMGAVAVRLLTADGRTWPNAKLSLARFEGNQATWARVIETYPDNESVNPNPAWGENGAMEAVPAGYYYLVGSVNGERVTTNFQVVAGQTTFVEVRTVQ